jgi:hypothetical protein
MYLEATKGGKTRNSRKIFKCTMHIYVYILHIDTFHSSSAHKVNFHLQQIPEFCWGEKSISKFDPAGKLIIRKRSDM